MAYLKRVSVAEIQADLKSIESELNEVLKLKGKRKRIEWAKRNPEKFQKIWDVYMKYEIEHSIKVLKELYSLIQPRLAEEKANCDAILRRTFMLGWER